MRISLLALLLVGCGGGDGGGTAFEGIWRVDTWTTNLSSCDVEGPSVAALNDPLFFTQNFSAFGDTFVNVKNCVDTATCKTEANDEDTLHLGEFGFETGSDAAGWKSHSAFGFAFQGQCQGDVTDTTMTIDASTFRIESRSVDAVPFAPSSDPDDECPDAKVEQAAAGQPCVRLEVVTATFVEKS